MHERHTIRLGDAIDIKHGHAFKGEFFSDAGPGPILVTPGNFAIGGGFQRGKDKYYTGLVPDGYTLNPGDLVVTMTDLSKAGDTLGYPALVPGDAHYLHNQRIGLVRVVRRDLLDTCYLSYALRTRPYRDYILAGATGSTVRHTSPSRIYEYRIAVPSVSEQRAIASVLKAFDDKIAVNELIALKADELIRARYLDLCISTGKSIPLSELGDQRRETVPVDNFGPDENYIGLEHMPRRRMWLSGWTDASGVASAKGRFEKGDVLFGKLRPYFHKVGLAFVGGIASTDIIVIRPRTEEARGWLLAAASSDEVVGHASAIADGTRMPRAKWQDIAKCNVPWPGQAAASEFNEVVEMLAKRVRAAVFENQALYELRDTLLPALMSGRVRVRDAGKVAEDAT
ncbi:restriction endonuclease subunit S [Micromonospora sp. NPDC049497]|uniref:restriction endonuclease subunit S n=1 Tax=Micromonospora sp. NPDC049497 TaxID=3364273 RepID=UPI0037B689F5